MHLSCLQLRSFGIWCIFFTYHGGTLVNKEDQVPVSKKTNPVYCKQQRPTISKKPNSTTATEIPTRSIRKITFRVAKSVRRKTINSEKIQANIFGKQCLMRPDQTLGRQRIFSLEYMTLLRYPLFGSLNMHPSRLVQFSLDQISATFSMLAFFCIQFNSCRFSVFNLFCHGICWQVTGQGQRSLKESRLLLSSFASPLPLPRFLLLCAWNWQKLCFQIDSPDLSVPWSLRPHNRSAAVVCRYGRCKLPAILRLIPKIASSCDFWRPSEAKNLRFLQRSSCEPARGHRGCCDFAMRSLRRQAPDQPLAQSFCLVGNSLFPLLQKAGRRLLVECQIRFPWDSLCASWDHSTKFFWSVWLVAAVASYPQSVVQSSMWGFHVLPGTLGGYHQCQQFTYGVNIIAEFCLNFSAKFLQILRSFPDAMKRVFADFSTFSAEFPPIFRKNASEISCAFDVRWCQVCRSSQEMQVDSNIVNVAFATSLCIKSLQIPAFAASFCI